MISDKKDFKKKSAEHDAVIAVFKKKLEGDVKALKESKKNILGKAADYNSAHKAYSKKQNDKNACKFEAAQEAFQAEVILFTDLLTEIKNDLDELEVTYTEQANLYEGTKRANKIIAEGDKYIGTCRDNVGAIENEVAKVVVIYDSEDKKEFDSNDQMNDELFESNDVFKEPVEISVTETLQALEELVLNYSFVLSRLKENDCVPRDVYLQMIKGYYKCSRNHNIMMQFDKYIDAFIDGDGYISYGEDENDLND